MNRGFSLVELSIVLVVLGLLVGGVLGGKSLIRASELRSVVTEYQNYVSATNSFRDKYFALPGDITNATDFWGTMTNCGVASPSGTGTQTCNGDGDGLIEVPSAASRTGELFGFWQHLVNAGMIEGSYTGIAGSAGAGDSIISTNIPAGKISSSGWGISYWNYAGDIYSYAFNYGNMFTFGKSNSPYDPSGRIIKPEEAWNIDKKIDDGLPAKGKFIAIYWDTCTTSSSFSDYEGVYDLDNTSIDCAFRIRNAF